MKMLFSFLILIAGSPAFAQLILDQQMNLSHDDFLFPSANEPNTIYMFPKSLSRLSDVQVISKDDRVKVQFDVGISSADYARVEALIAGAGLTDRRAAVVRAVDVVAEPGTNIDPRYRPIVTVAGDIRNLTGPVRYVLSVRNRGTGRTLAMLKDLFSDKNMDHVLNLSYQFSAVVAGQPYLAKSAVGVMVGTRNGIGAFEPKAHFFEARLSAPGVQILMDKETGCWERPAIGVACLR